MLEKRQVEEKKYMRMDVCEGVDRIMEEWKMNDKEKKKKTSEEKI